MMTGQKNGMLYELDATGPPASDPIYAAALISFNRTGKLSIEESKMWHRRLGHLGDAAIKSIINGYVDDGRICEVCIQAKLRRKIIRVPVQRTTTPFELVHSDLCGPFATRSSGGAQYFIIYIDDYSRHTEIMVLPDKRSETCTAAFQWFQAKVDGWGYDIRRFRSDNGSGEYNNKTFRGILAVRGIAFEPCPPHTQHKNGIAERMIGVLTQKARAMMLDSQAPMQFWAEAINTACYLHRRTPNQSLDGKTPYEVLKCHRRLYRNGYNSNSQRVSTALSNSQRVSMEPEREVNSTSAQDKPILDHLRRFGCVVWKHIPKSQRMDAKMGTRAKACMMLGYVHDTTKIW
jgi:transposase InsO family protein